LSALTTDWGDNKVLCNGVLVKNTELSIIQTKNPTYSGDCSNVCEQDTGYCVDFSTITTYYKDENDEWIPWGRWNGNGDACSITARSESLNCSGNMKFGISTDEASWTWLDPNYELPYFGGSMRVTWEYSAYTVYEDCTTSMTRSYDSCDNCGYIAETIGETCPECESTNISHNRLIWEDILDILPYEGECYDELKNQCGIISIKSEEANRCDGGTTKFEFAINENVEPDYVINTIKYIFKKAPCELTDKDRFPETIGALCDTGETEDNGDCNKFTIKYKQKKTICDDECGSCIKTHDEGVFVCSKCGYKIGAYEDKTTHKMKPYADKCPICETEFKTGETETDYQVLSDSMTYYLPSALTDRKFTDSDCYDTTCTLKLIDKPFWVTAVTVNEGSITYEVEDNTGSDREGGVTFQLNGRDCYDTVLLSQYGTRESVDPHDKEVTLDVSGDRCPGTELIITPNFND
jgi:RNA polymerase subunit RPABC4/transcription elongation factor Spt4